MKRYNASKEKSNPKHMLIQKHYFFFFFKELIGYQTKYNIYKIKKIKKTLIVMDILT